MNVVLLELLLPLLPLLLESFPLELFVDADADADAEETTSILMTVTGVKDSSCCR